MKADAQKHAIRQSILEHVEQFTQLAITYINIQAVEKERDEVEREKLLESLTDTIFQYSHAYKSKIASLEQANLSVDQTSKYACQEAEAFHYEVNKLLSKTFNFKIKNLLKEFISPASVLTSTIKEEKLEPSPKYTHFDDAAIQDSPSIRIIPLSHLSLEQQSCLSAHICRLWHIEREAAKQAVRDKINAQSFVPSHFFYPLDAQHPAIRNKRAFVVDIKGITVEFIGSGAPATSHQPYGNKKTSQARTKNVN